MINTDDDDDIWDVDLKFDNLERHRMDCVAKNNKLAEADYAKYYSVDANDDEDDNEVGEDDEDDANDEDEDEEDNKVGEYA